MQLGELEYLISLNSNNLDKDLKKSDSKLTSWAVAKGKMIAGVLEKAMSTAAGSIKSVIGGAFSSFADYEQLVGGVETLFKESADKVQKYAAQAYKTVGISANEYMENVTSFSASLLQSLAGDTAAAADVADMAMQDMADNANKMGSSMDSIQNAYQGFAKQNYTMLDNLKLGYGGTKTEMERLLKDAEKLTGKKYDIQNLSDVYEAIHAIQEEMGITGTTALEAEKTVSGSINMAKASWRDLLTAIGSGQNVEGATQQFASSAKKVIANATPVITRTISSMLTAAKTIWPSVKRMIGDVAKSAFSTLKGMMPKSLRQLLNIGGTLIKRLTSAFKKDGMKGILKELKYFGKTAKISLAEWLKIENPEEASWGQIGKKLYEKVRDGVTSLIDKGKNALTSWLGLDKEDAGWFDIGKALFNKVRDGVQSLLEKGKNVLTGWLGIQEDANWEDIGKGLFNKIKTGAQSLIEKGKNVLTSWLGLQEDASWEDIGKSLGGKLKSGAQSVVTAGKNVLTDWLGIQEDASWSKIGSSLYIKIRDGAKSWLEKGKNVLTKWLGLEEDAGWGDIGKTLYTNVKTGATSLVEKGKNTLTSWLNLEADSSWSAIGANLAQRVKEGFRSMKLSLASLLGITNTSDPSDELNDRLKKKHIELDGVTVTPKLNTEDISWLDIGHFLSEKLSKLLDDGLKPGGWADNFITRFGEKWEAIFEVAGTIFESIANYLNDTGNQTKIADIIVNILQTVINSATVIIPKIVELLTTVFTNQTFLDGLMSLTQALCNLLVSVITNQDVWNAIVVLLDSVIRSVFGESFTSGILGKKKKLEWEEYTDSEGNTKRRSKIVEDTDYTPTPGQEDGLILGIAKNIIEDKTGIDMSEGSVGDKALDFAAAAASTALVPTMGGFGGVTITKKATSESNGALAKLGEILINSGTTTSDELVQGGEEAGEQFKHEIIEGVEYLVNTVSGLKIPIEGAPIFDPFSNAKGNWRVPYDNYPALLHRDEMVLSKSQARKFRDGGSGSGGISADALAQAVEAAMSRVYVMMSGEKVGDLTTRRIKRNLNASSYSRMRALGG